MATLWEINKEISSLIDYDTGEILDMEKFDSLKMERHEKLRNIAFLALNAESDIAALKAQKEKFDARIKAAERTARWAKETLERELDGNTMKEDEFVIAYNPPSVEIEDIALLPRKFFKVPQVKPPEPKPAKDEIKAAIKAGEDVPGVRLRRTVKIK